MAVLERMLAVGIRLITWIDDGVCIQVVKASERV
jgi:hypothetical protein